MFCMCIILFFRKTLQEKEKKFLALREENKRLQLLVRLNALQQQKQHLQETANKLKQDNQQVRETAIWTYFYD